MKIERHIGVYAGFLASCEDRGATLAEVWDAVVRAREVVNGRPLFGASIRTALAFLRVQNRGKNSQKNAAKSATEAYLSRHVSGEKTDEKTAEKVAEKPIEGRR